jgi:glutamine amidotransferase
VNVVIFDYGAGNLHSLSKALAESGAAVAVEADPLRAIRGDVLVLPGVGAFGAAAARLAPGLGEMRAAIAGGLPCLGICLGMQLLFDASDEGEGAGLGVFAGRVTQLKASRVPQIGWNSLDHNRDETARVAGLTIAYFANGYACRPTDNSIVTAWSEHEGDAFPAIVRRGRVVGTQFHPEKSSAQGLAFVRAFLEESAA